jgi:hypothetical protein
MAGRDERVDLDIDLSLSGAVVDALRFDQRPDARCVVGRFAGRSCRGLEATPVGALDEAPHVDHGEVTLRTSQVLGEPVATSSAVAAFPPSKPMPCRQP